MDSLTHTVLGACLGEIIAGKKIGKKAMLIGALANNFPDVDVVLNFFISPVQNLLAHRGITHSIFLCAVFSFLFSWLLTKILKKDGIGFKQSFVLIGSGLFLHILMDACTSYGTGWFEPFSNYRVSFNTLFIIDPFFLMPLLIASVILLFMKTASSKRTGTAQVALTVSAVYLLITFVVKSYVNNLVANDLSLQKIPNTDYMVTPAPLSNLLWNVITKNDSDCYVGYYSVFDKEPTIDYHKIHKNNELIGNYKNAEEVKMLMRFSKDYYRFRYSDSSLVFSDLRFGQIGGWYERDAPFVFNFDIIHKNDATQIQQGRIKAVSSKPLTELLKRIKGK